MLGIAAGLAIVVHGYHPYVEDAEIYVPAIKKALNPALYPFNEMFFMSHARMTLFPRLIAESVRLSHLPLGWALLLWQWFAIFLLLLACWHLGRIAFQNRMAQWGGVALLASLLTMPVAGTALYIMDEYINPRSLSTPAVLFIIISVVERRFVRAALWMLITAAIHPLMVVFGAAYALVYLYFSIASKRLPRSEGRAAIPVAALFPFGLFPPASDDYREALNSRPYFFLLRWQWYEWLGIFGPLLILEWWRRLGRRRGNAVFEHLCATSILFGIIFFVAALILTIPASLANLVELQPLRSLHLIYVIMLTLGGGLLAQYVLKNVLWRWSLLLIALCGVMAFVQLQTFSNTPHLEFPWTSSRNPWVRTFEWIRENTPNDAYFALDPETMALTGEDQHGFRAIAERSMLADNVKDTGAVTMFPAMARRWHEQVQSQAGWRQFGASQFRKLNQEYGVSWIVVQKPVPEFRCPYVNSQMAVCKIY